VVEREQKWTLQEEWKTSADEEWSVESFLGRKGDVPYWGRAVGPNKKHRMQQENPLRERTNKTRNNANLGPKKNVQQGKEGRESESWRGKTGAIVKIGGEGLERRRAEKKKTPEKRKKGRGFVGGERERKPVRRKNETLQQKNAPQPIQKRKRGPKKSKPDQTERGGAETGGQGCTGREMGFSEQSF